MGKKKVVLLPADEVEFSAVKYEYDQIESPHIAGSVLKLFVNILEAQVIGPLLISFLRKKNNMVELLKNTVIPETPMFKPEFPPQGLLLSCL